MKNNNHVLDLVVVVLAVTNAVIYSSTGNFSACLWAFSFAASVVFVARFQDLAKAALDVASQARDGWQKSTKTSERLIEHIDRLEKIP